MDWKIGFYYYITINPDFPIHKISVGDQLITELRRLGIGIETVWFTVRGCGPHKAPTIPHAHADMAEDNSKSVS